MKRFEYEITTHPIDQFRQLVYFCTDKGECAYNQLPQNQLSILGGILNEKGDLGWELVQLFFGKDGLVAIWKRVKSS